MGTFTFICPVTGMACHGWTEDEPPAFDYYEAVECVACQRVHLIDPRSGKVAGGKDEYASQRAVGRIR